MAILLTGGTGKTSLRLASLLQQASIPFLLASRHASTASPPGIQGVDFDWLDPSTHEAPFHFKFPNDEKITAVYLIAPTVADASESMIPFLKLAKERGVSRFVLLTGSDAKLKGEGEEGAGGVGKVWGELEGLGVEYTVLRATWFMENLTEWQHKSSIINENRIYSACGDAQVPFVSAKDIAAVAFMALTSSTPVKSTRVLGPELLSHDQIAEILSKGLGRKITHVKLTQEQSEKRYREDLGMEEHYAKFMAGLEAGTGSGKEERIFKERVVEAVIGRRTMGFEEWVGENRGVLCGD